MGKESQICYVVFEFLNSSNCLCCCMQKNECNLKLFKWYRQKVFTK